MPSERVATMIEDELDALAEQTRRAKEMVRISYFEGLMLAAAAKEIRALKARVAELEKGE